MTDTPVVGITADFDGERLCLRPGYAEVVERAGGVPVIIPVSGADPIHYSGVIDGLLIPGGDDIDPSYYGESRLFELKLASRTRTDFEIRLFREIIKLKRPVLGVCYGMQLMNVALGGSLYQDIGAQFARLGGSKSLNHGKEHEIEISSGPLSRGMYKVNSSHHQAVKRLGSGLVASAFSEDGAVEAFYMRDYPFVLGVEWHPERSEDELSRQIFSLFIEAAKCP